FCDPLVKAIPFRATNRNILQKQPLPPGLYDEMSEVARTVPGADLHFIYEEEELKEITEIVASADRIRMMHQGGHDDFIKEIRWTPQEAERLRTGIDLSTAELTPSELAGFSLAKNWEVIRYLNEWKGGK